MAQRTPVTEIYWEAVYADDPDNQNQSQNQNQNHQNQNQTPQNETETEEIEMKIYEDVGNTEEAQELREDIKSEKRKNKTL
jgi:hypothetical protein